MRFGEGTAEHHRAVAYYGTATVVTLFGLLGLASIGFPFLLAGVILFTAGPVRHRRDVLWPPLVGLAAFTVSYLVVAPYRCSASSSSPTRCENVLGFDPPAGVFTGLLVALAIGFVTAFAVRSAIRRAERT